MRILLATNNAHKRGEFASIFSGYEIISPADLGLSFDVEESGTTFLENALLKAEGLRALVKHDLEAAEAGRTIVVADDSGICVDALGGGPGIYSARFGSPDGGRTELDAQARNKLLLQAMEGTRDRSAHFVCAMVALMPADRLVVAQESWHGEIAEQPSAGAGGFGYDPVFRIPSLNLTAADLGADEKNRLSHRGRASRVLSAALHEAASLPE